MACDGCTCTQVHGSVVDMPIWAYVYVFVFVFASCDCLLIRLHVVLCMHGLLGMHILHAVFFFPLSWIFMSTVVFLFFLFIYIFSFLICGNCLLWRTWPPWPCAWVLWIFFQYQVVYTTLHMTVQLTCFINHFRQHIFVWSVIYRYFVIFWLVRRFFLKHLLFPP